MYLHSKQFKKIISTLMLIVFFFASIWSQAYAQIDSMPRMPPAGVMVHLSPEYTPAYLKGIVIHPENALKFDFIIYKGDKVLTENQKKIEYTKLTKYFLASLAIPDDDQWVNLSPYEKDRIIKDDFGKTEMGRDLLAEDYMLKQVTASLIYPEDRLGKEFWERVYSEAQRKYGTSNIPVNTFNKVWILPDDALIYEKGNTAYVLKNHLKVMLEEDYLSLRKHSGITSHSASLEIRAGKKGNDTHSIASKIVKEIVLPELEREVNEDKNFSTLRQVYSGMLLATWYKRALKESLLSKIYANKAKVKGVDQDPKTNERIYHQYLRAYKKGVFNFIKEDVDKYTNETIPRKYFSGGTEDYAMAFKSLGRDPVRLTPKLDAAQVAAVRDEIEDEDKATIAAEESRVATLLTPHQQVAMTNEEVKGFKELTVERKRKIFGGATEQQLEIFSLKSAVINFHVPSIELNSDGSINFTAESIDEALNDLKHARTNNEKKLVLKIMKKQFKDDPDLVNKLMEYLEEIINSPRRGQEALAFTDTLRTIVEIGGQEAVGLLKEIYSWTDEQWAEVGVGHGGSLFEIEYERGPIVDALIRLGARDMIDQFEKRVQEDPIGSYWEIRALTKWGHHQTARIENLYQLATSSPDHEQQAKAFLALAIIEDKSPKVKALLAQETIEDIIGTETPLYITSYRIASLINLHISSRKFVYSRESVLQKAREQIIDHPVIVRPEILLNAISLSSETEAIPVVNMPVVNPAQAKRLVGNTEAFTRIMAIAGSVASIYFSVPGLAKVIQVQKSSVSPAPVVQKLDLKNPLGKVLTIGNQPIPKVGQPYLFNGKEMNVKDIQRIDTKIISIILFDNKLQQNVEYVVNAIERGGQLYFDFSGLESLKSNTITFNSKDLYGANTKGGIDFNSVNLHLQIKRDGRGVPLPISQQVLENIHIDGLIPVVLDIVPARKTSLLSQF